MNTILQKRIEEAAQQYIQSDAVAPENMQLAFGDFINGAMWALQNQWISVEEELPPKEGIILAALTPEFCISDKPCYEVVAWHKGYDLRHSDAFYDVCGEEVPITAITHWIEFPSLKGGEK